MRRWKFALSLAVIAAIAVPAIAGTWRLAPGRWVDLTVSQKQRISNYLEQTNYCRSLPKRDEFDQTVIEKLVCEASISQLADGGSYYPPEQVTLKYLAKNFLLSAGAFALTFALVMLGPPVSRRYLAWLRR